MSIEAVEFDCVDCGRHIVSWVGCGDRCRCYVCAWVIENIPPEEHAVVRERLGVPIKIREIAP
jgi:hypothetical protein